MKRYLRLIIGIILVILGSSGISLPILAYINFREWALSLFNLFSPLFILLYLPFVCWLLITGIGILAKKKWAWYSVQILDIFLVITGVILLTALNSFPLPENLQFAWGRIKRDANLGVILLFLITPLFSLAYFHRIREDKEWPSYSSEALEDLYQRLQQQSLGGTCKPLDVVKDKDQNSQVVD